jgi:uncharacterized protein involved in type VI secretion and phage assembly
MREAHDDPALRWLGVHPGKVSSVKDEAKQGRVQVELMTVPGGNETFRVWARLATFMAGKGRGSFFIPEVGDEVLVAFQGGDVRHPFVVGALWNGQDAPPEQMDGGGKNDLRVLETRSGHRLEFDDGAQPKITLTTPTGCKLVLDDAGGGKITVGHPSGSYIELDAGGGVTIHAMATMTFSASTVEVQAPMSNFNGVTQHQTMIASAVVGSTYTPGAGNIW